MACTSKARIAYWSNAVTNTMAGARWTPTSRSTSKPSSSGICTSRNTRSGVTSRMAAVASRPFAHSPATAISRVDHFEGRLVTVQLPQTRAGVGEADTAAFRALEHGREPRPIVPDRKVQAAVDTPGADQQPTHRAARRDPVTDRVLNERLEDQIGYLGVERLGLRVHHRLETLAKPDLLDVEIAPQELQLLFQRHLLRTRTI